MKRFNFTLIIFFGFTIGIFAQQSQWKTFRNIDRINTFTLDGNYIWIGTNAGLIRFDTNTSETIHYDKINSGIDHDDIRYITMDSKRNKWITTQTGLCCFNDSTWVSIERFPNDFPEDYRNKIILGDKGYIWVATSSGLLNLIKNKTILSRFFDQSNSNIPSHKIRSIVIDTNGKLWLSSGGNGYNKTIYTLDGKKIPERESDLWDYGWLSYYNGKEFVNYRIDSMYFPLNTINCMLIDKYNRIWIGTKMGLTSFDGEKWTYYRKKEYFFNPKASSSLFVAYTNSTDYLEKLENIIVDLSTDIHENVWIALAEGLIKYNHDTWNIYEMGNNNYGFITAIQCDTKGNVWVASDKQIQRFNGDSLWTTIYTLPVNIFKESPIEYITTDRSNQKWVITSNEVIVFDSLNNLDHKTTINYFQNKNDNSFEKYNTVKQYFESQFNRTIDSSHIINHPRISLFEWIKNSMKDHNGMIYVAGDSLWKWTPENDFVNLKIQPYKSGYIWINDIAIDKDSIIWLIDRWGEIRTFDGVTWHKVKIPKKIMQDIRYKKIPRPKNSGRKKYLDSDKNLLVYSIYITDNNQKLFGTGEGLIEYNQDWIYHDKANLKMPFFKDIKAITTQSDCIWMGGETGLLKFDGKKWISYTVKNSPLPSNVINTITSDKNGNLWIGTDKGIAIFNENGIK